jgi:ribosomal protein L29
MDKWLPVIVQFAIVIVSAFSGWYLLRGQKAKLRADSESVMVETATGLVATLRKELDEAKGEIISLRVESKNSRVEVDFLRKELASLRLSTETEISRLKIELDKMRKRIAVLVKGIGVLTDQIKSLGHEPAWVDKADR